MADGGGTVEAAADELYGLAPDAFTARRNELGKAARAAGDKAAATDIAAMRKPTVPAWLVNLLVREAGDDLADLMALGEQLRDAQAQLQGPRIKELSGQASAAVQRLSRRAAELAAGHGQAVTASVDRDVEQTLRAALADPQAELAVASGRLTRALAYAGFGEVDVSAATATPLAAAAPPGSAVPAGAPPSAPAERRSDEGPAVGSAEPAPERAPMPRQGGGERPDAGGRPARGRRGSRKEAAGTRAEREATARAERESAARAEREATARAERESAARAEREATAQARRDEARAEEAATRAEHEQAARDAEAAARAARDAEALVEDLQERLAQARRDAAEAERAAGTAQRAEVRAARAARAAAAALRAATARSGD